MGALDASTEQVRKNLRGVKRIVAVYSGKGGVGKTTIAVNIAATLAQRGYRTCLLDADIDCPNVAHALGLSGTLEIDALDQRIIPAERFGLKVISMALLQEAQDQAIIWRGPMVTDMLMKFLGATSWGSVDYLIIDLPPGTSDIPLTVMRFVQPHGIVVVTTPRSIAETDARKSANLAKLTAVPVLGVIENMSGGDFGTGKGNECAHAIGTFFLGTVPFHKIYLDSIDAGIPAVFSDENARGHISPLVDRLREAEEHILESAPAKPGNRVLRKARNLSMDFKAELLDRYKSLKS